MKLCFSTLGCPQWDLPEIIATAKDFGYDGVELRGVKNELRMTRYKAFAPENIESTAKRFEERGVKIACITSGCVLSDPDQAEENRREIKQYVDVATALKAPYIRVMGDSMAGPGPHHVDDYLVVDLSKELADYAKEKGVTLLIESNGAYADSNRLAKLLQAIGHENVKVLWDINHTYRYFDESPKTTFDNIGKDVRHVHLKDSVVINGRIAYRLLGNGDLPVREVVSLLNEGGYKGFYSLEWLKRFDDTLEEPGLAFVHFVEFMRSL